MTNVLNIWPHPLLLGEKCGSSPGPQISLSFDIVYYSIHRNIHRPSGVCVCNLPPISVLTNSRPDISENPSSSLNSSVDFIKRKGLGQMHINICSIMKKFTLTFVLLPTILTF